jgi:hypothetical protein
VEVINIKHIVPKPTQTLDISDTIETPRQEEVEKDIRADMEDLFII